MPLITNIDGTTRYEHGDSDAQSPVFQRNEAFRQQEEGRQAQHSKAIGKGFNAAADDYMADFRKSNEIHRKKLLESKAAHTSQSMHQSAPPRLSGRWVGRILLVGLISIWMWHEFGNFCMTTPPDWFRHGDLSQFEKIFYSVVYFCRYVVMHPW